MVLIVLSAGYAATPDEYDIGEPPQKKIKQDDGHHAVLSQNGTNGRSKDFIHQKVLRKLLENKEEGCHFEEISVAVNRSRSGFAAVLESVVDVMFRTNMDVNYDCESHRYKLIGAAPINQSVPCDIHSALAYVLASTDVSKKISLGKLGYFLFKKGFRAKNYKDFISDYYAVSVICNVRLTSFLLRAKAISEFAQKRQGTHYFQMQSMESDAFPVMTREFEKHHGPCYEWEISMAKRLWGLGAQIRDNIQKAQKAALAMKDRKAQKTYDLSEKEKFMETLLLWDKLAPQQDPKNIKKKFVAKKHGCAKPVAAPNVAFSTPEGPTMLFESHDLDAAKKHGCAKPVAAPNVAFSIPEGPTMLFESHDLDAAKKPECAKPVAAQNVAFSIPEGPTMLFESHDLDARELFPELFGWQPAGVNEEFPTYLSFEERP